MSQQYHFIGIGGIGMGALAALALDKGWRVSGSDLRTNQVTSRLEGRGAKIFRGHDAVQVEGADYVVFSSAIKEDNPELKEARLRGIPVLRRAELLAELMEGFIGVTIAGAHGKTTTTSMIAELLSGAGLNPATAIGGIVNGTGSHAAMGQGKYFVTEVDESDGSFLYFSPRYSVITNIDFEHIDFYHDWERILDAYRRFIDKTDEDGIIFAYGEDARLLKLVRESGRRVRTYGFSSANDLYAANIRLGRFESRFDVWVDGKNLGEVLLIVPGRHNVANALACIALGLSLSLDFEAIRENLGRYRGVQRRFQWKGTVNDIWVIDDYAHHPTEIRNTLETAQVFKRTLGESSRMFVVFQPHRYSRLKALFNEFAESLMLSDHLIITDIYAASEQPIPGVTADKLCEKAHALGEKPVVYLAQERILDYLLSLVRPGDIVLTLGAGDITSMSSKIVEALKASSVAGSSVQ